MAVFELVVGLLCVGAVLAGAARRLNAPYPALLALAGAALALLPNVPSMTLDPQLALTLFVAPVLLDDATALLIYRPAVTAMVTARGE